MFSLLSLVDGFARDTRFLALTAVAAVAVAAADARTLAEFEWGRAPAGIGFVSVRDGVSDPMALGPQALAVAPDGRLALADTWNNRVLLMDRNGSVTGSVPVAGRPRVLALSAAGELAVATAGGPSLTVFDRTGALRWELEADPAAAAPVGQLDALAFAPSGHLLAGDIATGRIRVFSPEGRPEGELPWEGGGLASDADGAVLDLAFTPGSGYWLRSRKLGSGQPVRLAEVPGSETAAGGVLLGGDRSGRWYVRFSTRGSLAVFVLDSSGRKLRRLGLLPDRVQTSAVGVRADGALVWVAHDPSKAPRGKVCLRAALVP